MVLVTVSKIYVYSNQEKCLHVGTFPFHIKNAFYDSHLPLESLLSTLLGTFQSFINFLPFERSHRLRIRRSSSKFMKYDGQPCFLKEARC